MVRIFGLAGNGKKQGAGDKIASGLKGVRTMGPWLKNSVKWCDRILTFPRIWHAMGMIPYIGTEMSNVVPSSVPF